MSYESTIIYDFCNLNNYFTHGTSRIYEMMLDQADKLTPNQLATLIYFNSDLEEHPSLCIELLEDGIKSSFENGCALQEVWVGDQDYAINERSYEFKSLCY